MLPICTIIEIFRTILHPALCPCLPCQREVDWRQGTNCCFVAFYLRYAHPFYATNSSAVKTEGLSLHHPFQNRTIPQKSPPHLPPLSKVRCCRPKKFGRLPKGLSLHHPFQNRTITLAFRSAIVCVCLYGFAFKLSHLAFRRARGLPLPLHRTYLSPRPL